ncbi:MAG: beta-ketoacyl synthase, partial [Bryobacterales bacterium]|nr:beta-ketoacyl synthase [Bryobacterales bacterium]
MARESDSQRAGIAIVGMACTYPGARDLRQYWQNILDKVDSVTDVSRDRWDPDVFFDPDPSAEDKIYCKKGGWIGGTFAFNPLQYGIPPSTVPGAEPDHFLVLRAVGEAMGDAGYLDKALGKLRVSVVLGKGNYLGPGVTALMYRGIVTEQTMAIIQGLHPEFDEEQMAAIKRQLRERLPGMNAEVAAGLIPNICTGRVANRLDFMGRNFTVDAACASSLIATEIAIQDLESGKEDIVLAGGVH